jgi:hypothetical protein
MPVKELYTRLMDALGNGHRVIVASICHPQAAVESSDLRFALRMCKLCLPNKQVNTGKVVTSDRRASVRHQAL